MAGVERGAGAVPPTALLGTWELRRRLVDRRAGVSGRVRGWLELCAAGPDVRWLERGVLCWRGAEHPVSRELRVVREGDDWAVRFADGRPFHPWWPGRVVEHPCRADLYRGLIRVDRDGARLRVLWDVTGPGKAQRILTRCHRLPGGAGTG